MTGSISNIPALSLGARFAMLAEQKGYRGKGAIAFPVMSEDGKGTINFVVSEEPLASAPLGTVLYNPKERTFQHRTPGDNGPEWADLGSDPNVSSLLVSDYAEHNAPLPLPPLPALPDPNEEAEHDLSIITDPVTQYNVLPNEKALKPNLPSLKVGTGNPADNMVVVNNGELELAAAIRFYRVIQTFESQEGVYAIDLEDSTFATKKDWAWVFSMLLLNEVNGNNITDLYDLTMTIEAPNGELLRFNGNFNNGTFHLVSDDAVLDIVDSYTTGYGNICQNIQRVTFYVDQLPGTELGGNGSPIGTYTIEIRAERKRGDVEPLVLTLTAEVTDSKEAPVVVQTFAAEQTGESLPTFDQLPAIEADGEEEEEQQQSDTKIDSTTGDQVNDTQEDPGFNSTDPVELDIGTAPSAARGQSVPMVHVDTAGYFELPENKDVDLSNMQEMELRDDDVMVPVSPEGDDVPPTYPCPTCNAGDCVPFGGESDTIELDGKIRIVDDLSGARCNNCGATFYNEYSLDRRAAAETELLEEAVAEEVGADHEQPSAGEEKSGGVEFDTDPNDATAVDDTEGEEEYEEEDSTPPEYSKSPQSE